MLVSVMALYSMNNLPDERLSSHQRNGIDNKVLRSHFAQNAEQLLLHVVNIIFNVYIKRKNSCKLFFLHTHR